MSPQQSTGAFSPAASGSNAHAAPFNPAASSRGNSTAASTPFAAPSARFDSTGGGGGNGGGGGYDANAYAGGGGGAFGASAATTSAAQWPSASSATPAGAPWQPPSGAMASPFVTNAIGAGGTISSASNWNAQQQQQQQQHQQPAYPGGGGSIASTASTGFGAHDASDWQQRTASPGVSAYNATSMPTNHGNAYSGASDDGSASSANFNTFSPNNAAWPSSTSASSSSVATNASAPAYGSNGAYGNNNTGYGGSVGSASAFGVQGAGSANSWGGADASLPGLSTAVGDMAGEHESDGRLQEARTTARTYGANAPSSDKFIFLGPAPGGDDDVVASVTTSTPKSRRVCDGCRQMKECSKASNEHGRAQMLCVACRIQVRERRACVCVCCDARAHRSASQVNKKLRDIGFVSSDSSSLFGRLASALRKNKAASSSPNASAASVRTNASAPASASSSSSALPDPGSVYGAVTLSPALPNGSDESYGPAPTADTPIRPTSPGAMFAPSSTPASTTTSSQRESQTHDIYGGFNAADELARMNGTTGSRSNVPALGKTNTPTGGDAVPSYSVGAYTSNMPSNAPVNAYMHNSASNASFNSSNNNNGGTIVSPRAASAGGPSVASGGESLLYWDVMLMMLL
jgi:hypothetical protein